MKAIKAIGGAMALTLASAGICSAEPFTINQTFSQGADSDLPATTISLGAGGSFVVDPAFSPIYFDFTFGGGSATFSTTSDSIQSYYFLRSYSAGEVIGAGNFGNHLSVNEDWDTILVLGQTAGVWGASHSGFLGFVNSENQYGYIEYNFTRAGEVSTIQFLTGAYSEVAGADIVAGTAAPVPEPASMLLVATGLAAAGVRRWRQQRA